MLRLSLSGPLQTLDTKFYASDCPAQIIGAILARPGLQEQQVNTLPNGRPLGFGDYKDASRPLRRVLKQFGSGNLEEGVKCIRGSTDSINEMVRMLSIDRSVRARPPNPRPQQCS